MAPPTKKPAGDRVLRPPNAFILYRSEMQPKLVAENKGGGRSSRDWSGIVGQMWKNEDPVVKAKYHEMARSRLLEHKQKYPDYKYAPGRKKAKEAAAAKEAMAKPAAKKGSKRKRNYEEDDFEEEDEPSDLEDDSDVAHAFVGSGSGGAHTNASWAAAPSNHTQPPPSSDRRFSSSSSSKTSASRSMVMGPPAPMPGAGLAAVAPSISHAPEQHANFVKIRRLNGTHVMVVTKPPTNCSVFQPTPIASPLRSSSNPMIPPHSARLTSGPEAYARLKAGMQRLKANFHNSLLRLAANKAPSHASLNPLTIPQQHPQLPPFQRQQASPLYPSPLSMAPALPPAEVPALPASSTQFMPLEFIEPIQQHPSTPHMPQAARSTPDSTPRQRFQVRLKLTCKALSCGPPGPHFESALKFHAHLSERHGTVARVVDARGAAVEVARDAADGMFHCLCCTFRSWDVVEFETHMLTCATEKGVVGSVQTVEDERSNLGGCSQVASATSKGEVGPDPKVAVQRHVNGDMVVGNASGQEDIEQQSPVDYSKLNASSSESTGTNTVQINQMDSNTASTAERPTEYFDQVRPNASVLKVFDSQPEMSQDDAVAMDVDIGTESEGGPESVAEELLQTDNPLDLVDTLMQLETKVVPTEEFNDDGPTNTTKDNRHSGQATELVEIAPAAEADSLKRILDMSDEASDPDMKRSRASSTEVEVDPPSDIDGMEGDDAFGADSTLEIPIPCPYSGCAAILTSRKKLRSHKYVRHAKTCPLTFKNGERFTLTRDASGFLNCPFCAYGSLDVSNIQRHGRTRNCNQAPLIQAPFVESGVQVGDEHVSELESVQAL